MNGYKKTIHGQVKDDNIKSPTTLKRLLDELEKNGYVVKPSGKRSGYTSTEKGKDYLKRKGVLLN